MVEFRKNVENIQIIQKVKLTRTKRLKTQLTFILNYFKIMKTQIIKVEEVIISSMKFFLFSKSMDIYIYMYVQFN